LRIYFRICLNFVIIFCCQKFLVPIWLISVSAYAVTKYRILRFFPPGPVFQNVLDSMNSQQLPLSGSLYWH